MKSFSENRGEIVYNVSKDITATLTWMKHILRGAKQNQTKYFVMEQISDTYGLWISNWAKKNNSIKITSGPARILWEERGVAVCRCFHF